METIMKEADKGSALVILGKNLLQNKNPRESNRLN